MLDVDAFLTILGCRGSAIADLAQVWPVMPDRLVRALAAAGVGVDDRQAIVVHVRIDERLAEHEAARADAQAHPIILDTVADAACSPPGLHVADDLSGLPLLALAADLAAHTPGGRVSVEVCEATQIDARGYFSRTSRGAAIILAADLDADERAETFAHELAHAVDPEFATVEPRGREAFAEELAPLLLAHEPKSEAEAAFLVARALVATAALRRYRPPVGSVAALVEWALVDTGVLEPVVEFAAACRVRGVNRLASMRVAPAEEGLHHDGLRPGPAIQPEYLSRRSDG